MDRREQILAAAGRIVVGEGIGALSVRAIAREAGVGASTLRHYFPTQGELYSALARDVISTAVGDRRIQDESIPAADRLMECLEQFLPRGDAPQAELRGWFDAYVKALEAGADVSAAAVVAQLHAASRDAVMRWLTLLAAEGHGDPTQTAQTATALLALLDGISLHLLADPERVTVTVAHAALCWAVDAAVRPPAASS